MCPLIHFTELEPEFVNVYGAQESFPRNRFREIDSASLCSLAGQKTNRVVIQACQDGNRFLGSLKGVLSSLGAFFLGEKKILWSTPLSPIPTTPIAKGLLHPMDWYLNR